MGSTIDIWPPVASAAELRRLASESLARELDWIVDDIVAICQTDLKHGLQDCYALLAPIDPGSTLVMSTHRNEKVKGTLTRVGTRIVKGTLNVQLRTLPAHAITVTQPLHIAALDAIHALLTQSIDLLGLTTTTTPPPSPATLSSTLALLSDSLSECKALLTGHDAPTAWTTSSCPPHHFADGTPPLSFHMAVQDSSLVLWLRALEPADAPVHFGTKLGLAIGTVRRLEHDEMHTVFRYHAEGDGSCEPRRDRPTTRQQGGEDVLVREKVRTESADPSLISLQAKLGYLSHVLAQARHNLAAVMDVNLDA